MLHNTTQYHVIPHSSRFHLWLAGWWARCNFMNSSDYKSSSNLSLQFRLEKFNSLANMNTMQCHIISNNTIHYQTIPSNTIQYHAMQCNTSLKQITLVALWIALITSLSNCPPFLSLQFCLQQKKFEPTADLYDLQLYNCTSVASISGFKYWNRVKVRINSKCGQCGTKCSWTKREEEASLINDDFTLLTLCETKSVFVWQAHLVKTR